NIPVLRGARGSWYDVVLEGGRIGASELYDSSWRSVHVVGCKLGYVNLRGAHLRDVMFTDCTIDEFDLVQAKLDRVAFADTTVGRLDVREARLTDVDLRGAELDGIDGVASLRGATIDGHQLVRLAPLLAREVGGGEVGECARGRALDGPTSSEEAYLACPGLPRQTLLGPVRAICQ